MFLLRYISEPDFLQSIRAETAKVESYNDFLDWIGFGGPVLKSGALLIFPVSLDFYLMQNAFSMGEKPERIGSFLIPLAGFDRQRELIVETS